MFANKESILADCPVCDGDVLFTSLPRLGERLTCRACGAKLTVSRRVPLELGAGPANGRSREDEKRQTLERRRLRQEEEAEESDDD